MSVLYPDMVDAIPQIRKALTGLNTSLTYNMSEQWPRTAITENLITVMEITIPGRKWIVWTGLPTRST